MNGKGYSSRTNFFQDGYEDKRWSIVLEEVTKTGQRKPLAQAKLNLSDIIGESTDEKIFKEIHHLELKGYKGESNFVSEVFDLDNKLDLSFKKFSLFFKLKTL